MTTAKPRIYLGLDVGKTDHWACALTEDGQVLWNKTLPNDEAKIIDIYTKLATQGQVLIVVDQPATSEALNRPGFDGDSFYLFPTSTSVVPIAV